MEEIWKPTADANYLISNLGNVKSLKTYKILNPGHAWRDYKKVTLTVNGKRKPFSVHRLVAIAFIPNPENKPHINHKNGDKLDNHVSNLEWVTHRENMVHYQKLRNLKAEVWLTKMSKSILVV